MLVNRLSPRLVSTTMVLVLLLPLVSVAADTKPARGLGFCTEGDVNVLQECPDGTWKVREVCRNGVWVEEEQDCPEEFCTEGDVNVLEYCPDGTWKIREICWNGAWVMDRQECPCTEGEVRKVLETCPDGETWKRREICRNDVWEQEEQECPCIQGEVGKVLNTCPDGETWKRREICECHSSCAWRIQTQPCVECENGKERVEVWCMEFVVSSDGHLLGGKPGNRPMLWWTCEDGFWVSHSQHCEYHEQECKENDILIQDYCDDGKTVSAWKTCSQGMWAKHNRNCPGPSLPQPVVYVIFAGGCIVTITITAVATGKQTTQKEDEEKRLKDDEEAEKRRKQEQSEERAKKEKRGDEDSVHGPEKAGEGGGSFLDTIAGGA